MDGNFKARCVDANGAEVLYTPGIVYEFEGGYIIANGGIKMPSEPVKNFAEWCESTRSKWELVDESENEKVGGFIHCKICKRRFELKKPFRYVAVKTESIFPLKSVLYDAFDCPHCGCQNIVGIRESEVKNVVKSDG